MKTRITELFGIDVPIIQAGMVWTSGQNLAVAVSEAGGLGLIGAGSMKPEILRQHIQKARSRTRNPYGVNIPIIRGDVDELVRVTVEEGVRIVFTSSGHPAKLLGRLKDAGCIVTHVVASVKHAKKAAESGCDAVVAEGFEAGGHNGIDEITTLCLIPQVADAVQIPVIAAGGIADGRQMCAAFALGAEGVQIGTRFAATIESSSHERNKQAIVEAHDTSTLLTLKKVTPVRLIMSPFAQRAKDAESWGATKEELFELFASKREQAGIFEGNWEEGEFEAGQSSGLVHEILPARKVVENIMREFDETRRNLLM